MVTTVYPKGERPHMRFVEGSHSTMPEHLLNSLRVTRVNSKTVYFVSEYVVGEMACDRNEVIIVNPGPKRYVVTYTSMEIEADSEEEAIARAEESSGGHWEATEVHP